MRSARLLACIAWAAALPVHAQAPATQAQIVVGGAGPYHRLSLPLALYGRVKEGDLSLLRVRNAAGAAVPFSWLDEDSQAEPQTRSQAVPIFPLPSLTEGATPSVLLSLRTDGTVMLTGRSSAGAHDDAAQWLIDASQVKGALVQAHFEMAPQARGVFPFALDASNDLAHWQTVRSDEQLLKLDHAGQTLERLDLDLSGQRARYLRLRWLNPGQAAALRSVRIDSVRTGEPASPLAWSAPIAPERCTPDYCDYAMPRDQPLYGLRIELADTNTLAQVAFAGLVNPIAAVPQPRHRHNPLHALRHAQGPRTSAASGPEEVALTEVLVYRLSQAGGEARSPQVELDGQAYSWLRLRAHIDALGSKPPRLMVAGMPRSLVFLAQGPSPYSLDWGGRRGDADGALPMATLMPRRDMLQPVIADNASLVLPALPASLPMPQASAASPVAAPAASKYWLWGVLGAGLVLLAFMARSVTRGLAAPPSRDSSS